MDDMMVSQMIYTSCRKGRLSMGSGFGIYNVTRDVAENSELMDSMMKTADYSITGTGLPRELTAENKSQFPVAYRYLIINNITLLSCGRHRGLDWNNSRPGNFLVHTITYNKNDASPVTFCNDKVFPDFSRDPFESDDLKAMNDLELDNDDYLKQFELSDSLYDDSVVNKVSSFLSNEDKNKMDLSNMISEIILGSKEIKITSNSESGFLRIAALELFFPPTLTSAITFDTFYNGNPKYDVNISVLWGNTNDVTCAKPNMLPNDFKDYIMDVCGNFDEYYNSPESFRHFLNVNNAENLNEDILEYFELFQFRLKLQQETVSLTGQDRISALIEAKLNNLSSDLLKNIINNVELTAYNTDFISKLVNKVNDPSLTESFTKKRESLILQKIINGSGSPSIKEVQTYGKKLQQDIDENKCLANLEEKELFILLKLSVIDNNKEFWKEVYTKNKEFHGFNDPISLIHYDCRQYCDNQNERLFWNIVYEGPIDLSTREKLESFANQEIQKGDTRYITHLDEYDKIRNTDYLIKFCEKRPDSTIDAFLSLKQIRLTRDMLNRIPEFRPSTLQLLNNYDNLPELIKGVECDFIQKIESQSPSDLYLSAYKMITKGQIDSPDIILKRNLASKLFDIIVTEFKDGFNEKEAHIQLTKENQPFRVSSNVVRSPRIMTTGFLLKICDSIDKEDDYHVTDTFRLSSFMLDKDKSTLFEWAINSFKAEGNSIFKRKKIKTYCENMYNSLHNLCMYSDDETDKINNLTILLYASCQLLKDDRTTSIMKECHNAEVKKCVTIKKDLQKFYIKT